MSDQDHVFEMKIEKIPGNRIDFNHWTINGKSFPDIERLQLEKGKRYRLFFNNDSGDIHPLHLHRHTFEITQVAGKPMAGLRKDSSVWRVAAQPPLILWPITRG